jgi:hypothetical protein
VAEAAHEHRSLLAVYMEKQSQDHRRQRRPLTGEVGEEEATGLKTAC